MNKIRRTSSPLRQSMTASEYHDYLHALAVSNRIAKECAFGALRGHMSAPVPTRVEHSIKTSLYLQTFGESDGLAGDPRSFCDLPDETQQYLSWWDEPADNSDSTSEDTHTAHEYELDSSDDSDEYEPIIEWAEPAQKHKRTGSRAGMSSRTCTRGMQRSFSYDDLDKVESFRLSSDISIEDGLVMLRHPYKLDSAEMRRTAVWFSRIQRKHSM